MEFLLNCFSAFFRKNKSLVKKEEKSFFSSIFFAAISLLLSTGCSFCCVGKNIYGPDEFVMDSYRVQEGKSAILEMQGYPCEELDPSFLQVVTGKKGFVVIMGGVANNMIEVEGSLGLFTVLAKAKIAKDANLFKSYVSRNGKILPVDMYRLVVQADMSQNIQMQPNDKVYIAGCDEANVMILGEVHCPQVLPVRGGYVSLRYALVKAGGVCSAADTSCIQIIRKDICDPKIYYLRWEHILALPEQSLLLIPGDVVYVSATPLAQWHRFLSHLVPSFSDPKVVLQPCRQAASCR